MFLLYTTLPTSKIYRQLSTKISTFLSFRVFSIFWNRPSYKHKRSFFHLRSTYYDDLQPLWIEHILLLLILLNHYSNEYHYYAFFQYIDISDVVSAISKALLYVFFRCKISNGINLTLKPKLSLHDEHIQVIDWFRLVQFQLIFGIAQALRYDIPIKHFSLPSHFL